MSSNYESNNMTATSLEALIQANGQAMEVREQVPYRPAVYAIPEEWLQAEKAMLEQAVKFQPELYQLIRQRATRQEFQQMQEQQLRTIRTELREQTSSIRSTLQQDGSVREQNFSRTSDLLSANRQDMRELTKRLENNIKKLMIGTAVSSAVLSLLVCTVWYLLVG